MKYTGTGAAMLLYHDDPYHQIMLRGYVTACVITNIYIALSRLQACNKSHTVPLHGRSLRGRRDIKHIEKSMATPPRACACIFHKTLGLMLYLLPGVHEFLLLHTPRKGLYLDACYLLYLGLTYYYIGCSARGVCRN